MDSLAKATDKELCVTVMQCYNYWTRPHQLQLCRYLGTFNALVPFRNYNLIRGIEGISLHLGSSPYAFSRGCKLVDSVSIYSDRSATKFVLKIRWRFRITKGEPSSNFWQNVYHKMKVVSTLKHWGRDKMATILQPFQTHFLVWSSLRFGNG